MDPADEDFPRPCVKPDTPRPYRPVSWSFTGLVRCSQPWMRLGYNPTTIPELDSQALSNAKVLILEKNTILPGSTQNQVVQKFVQSGGRVIVMEQLYSLFPALPLEEKPVLKAFIRAYDSPVLQGLEEADLAYWGDAPYALLAGDTYVAKAMYRKDDGALMLPILDSGEGGFGSGTMDYTPLFEAREGEGLILACQMRISDKIQDTPAAERLFVNLLQRAIEFKPDKHPTPSKWQATDNRIGRILCLSVCRKNHPCQQRHT